MRGFRVHLPGGGDRCGGRTHHEGDSDALRAAVAAARPGHHVGDIGAAVVGTVRGTGLSIIRDLVGHGVGRAIHEEPQVSNIGRPGFGMPLRQGMVLAIEPMLAMGTERIATLEDRWTVITADRALSAHFEHTVAVTTDRPPGTDRRRHLGRAEVAAGRSGRTPLRFPMICRYVNLICCAPFGAPQNRPGGQAA